MRILIVNYEFPPLGGGAGKASFCLAKEFVETGHKVLVLTTHFANLQEEECIEGIKIWRIKLRRKMLYSSSSHEMIKFIILAVFKLPNIIEEFRPEVCLSFFGIPCGVVSFCLKKIYKVPYIVSLRGFDVPGFNPHEFGKFHLFLTPFIKLIWKNADRVVANSCGLRALAKKTAQKFGKAIDVIPNGVDLERFYPNPKLKKDTIINLLFVGRFASQKNLAFLLKVFALVSKEFHNVKFALIGDGSERENLQALAGRLRISKKIEVSGWLSYQELLKRYQSADIFMFLSCDEGMPNVVLEAMACGLPIIASKVRGNDELVLDGQNGFLVSLRDEREVADFLKRLIKDQPLRIKMGRRSRKIVQNFSWRKPADQYISYFSAIVT